MRYTKEEHDFFVEFVPGHDAQQIADEFIRRFHKDITIKQVYYYKHNHNLHTGSKKNMPTELFPQEVYDFIHDNYIGTGPLEMSRILNEKFGTTYSKQQIKGFYRHHGLNSGLDGKYTEGHASWNKGKKFPGRPRQQGQFEKGSIPHNHQEIGTLQKRKKGYFRKMPDGTWKREQIRIWEEAHGPVPDGGCIRFLDGDRFNCSLENLVLVDRLEHVDILRQGGYVEDPEVNKTITAIAKLNVATKKAERKIKDEH